MEVGSNEAAIKNKKAYKYTANDELVNNLIVLWITDQPHK